ncbi:MAG: hypothetical protein NTV34_10360 [Proteobacteria bacterium]|nr:hypothetical protein [Pseudomonadota bacterium]
MQNITEIIRLNFWIALFCFGYCTTVANAKQLAPEAEYTLSARVGIDYMDDGLKPREEYEPTPQTNIYQGDLKLGVRYSVTQKTKFSLIIDPTREDLVEEAKAIWQGENDFKVVAGKTYINLGGWGQKDWRFDTLLVSPYVRALMPWIAEKNRALRTGAVSKPTLSFAANIFDYGALTFQLVNDVIVDDDPAAGFSHSRRQPAILAEFLGENGLIQPLLQLATYDINHSVVATIGVRTILEFWEIHMDFVIDRRNKPPSYDKQNITEYRNAYVDAQVRFSNSEIVGTLIVMDVKQPQGQYGVDHKGNQPGVEFDDNAFDIALGYKYKLDGEVFKPYIAIVRRSGVFLKDKNDPRGDSQYKAEAGLTVGVTSSF